VIESDLISTVRELASLRCLDLIDADAVVKWAVERVADAPANGALVQIACEHLPADSPIIDSLLDELLKEFGDQPMDDRNAGWTVARLLAERIVGGSIPADTGAKKIWWDVGNKVPALQSRLRVFSGLSSLWEDDARHRVDYERDIVTAASKLLDESIS
jgi:hypothetical protein